MLPYFIAIIMAVSVIFIAYRFNFNEMALKIAFLIASLPLIVIAGFKYKRVGTDTHTYIEYFNYITSFSDVQSIVKEAGEIGYWSLMFLGHFFTDNYFIIFTFTAIIVASCYSYSLKKFNLKTLSLISLLLIGPYFFQLNGNRQAITIAIFSISIIFLIKKQPLKYFTSILIGFLFHKSIIICLPIYFIFRGEIKARKIAIILFFFIIFLVFFQSFINIASGVDARYSSYGKRQDSAGGIVMSSFNLLLLAWFVFCRRLHPHILGTKTYDTLLVLYLLGSLISILSVVLGIDPSGFLRMSLYFIQVNIFLLPMTILSFRDETTRHIITFAAVMLMLLYFYMTTSAFSDLAPYRFNPIIEMYNEN